MPEKLDEEKIQEVLDTYEEVGSYSGTAEKTGISKKTVKKYVKRRLESDDDDESESQGGDTAADMIEMEGKSDRLVDLTDQELMEMAEAEFIRTFFREFDSMGVRDSFVEMIANQAQVRKQIPDEDQMSQRLQSHNSGVGNANDANAIAELYWALAQRYLNARGLASNGGGPGGPVNTGAGAGSYGGGDWVSAPDGGRAGQPQGGQQPAGDGEWVDTNPGSGGQQGRQPQQGQPQQGGGGMEQMFQQMMAQQQSMMRQMMESNQKTEKDELREEISRLREEVNGGGGGDSSMTDSLKEFLEVQQMLEQSGESNDDGRMEEAVGTLQQQLSALQREIQENDSSGNVAEMMSGTDSQVGMLMGLAQSSDMDPEEMIPLAQKLGDVETDPQVAEKKYEKEIEEMKLEAEREKWQSIFDGVEELTTSFGDLLSDDLPVEMGEEGGDEPERREVEAAGGGAEPREQVPEGTMSPAERMVAEGADTEPAVEQQPVESEGITPDSQPEETVEAEVADGGGVVLVDEESDLVGDEVEPDADDAVVDEEPDPESEAEPEQNEWPCTNEGCDRTFDSEMGLRGHLGSCPHGDN